MKTQLYKSGVMSLLAIAVIGCGGSGSSSPNAANYSVQVTNLTQNQPLSPPAIILHRAGYNAFIDGETASVELEQLAEGGDPAMLIARAQSTSQHLATVAGSAVSPRSIGTASTLSVAPTAVDNLRLTVVTMLIDTNDAFTGVNAVNISNMTVGQSMTFSAPSWDSGTEANLETAATMPGPVAVAAGGGGAAAGFNAIRDDSVPRVRFHQGVVTNANVNDASSEGLATSILTERERWDNPTSRIVITRTQ